MAVSVAIRTSADPVNNLGFGADGGLYCGGLGARGGGAYGYTLDNSQAQTDAGRAFYYTLPTSGFTTATMAANTCYVSPLMVARGARLTELYGNVSTAGAGSAVNVAVFANNNTTGLPGAKITDLARFDTTVTGQRSATILSNTFIFSASTLYWVAMWASTTGGYPAMHVRSGGAGTAHTPLRLSAVPTNLGWWGTSGWLSLIDTTSAWSTLTSAPATLTTPQPSPTAALATPNGFGPYYWWGLYNV